MPVLGERILDERQSSEVVKAEQAVVSRGTLENLRTFGNERAAELGVRKVGRRGGEE